MIVQTALQFLADNVPAPNNSANPVDNPVGYLIGLGPVGIVLALFITGKLNTPKESEAWKADSERKNAVIDAKDTLLTATQAGIIAQAIPALASATSAIERLPDMELRTLEELRSINRSLQDLTQEIRGLRGPG